MFRFKSICLEDRPPAISLDISLTNIIESQRPEIFDIMNELSNSLVKERGLLVPSFSGQKVCGVARCFRCQKPRCLYSSKPLTSNNNNLLHERLATTVYACTSALLPPGHSLEKTIYTKNLDCTLPVETDYYHSSFAVQTTCSKCGGNGGELPRKNPGKTRLRPQLPICKKCQLLESTI